MSQKTPWILVPAGAFALIFFKLNFWVILGSIFHGELYLIWWFYNRWFPCLCWFVSWSRVKTRETLTYGGVGWPGYLLPRVTRPGIWLNVRTPGPMLIDRIPPPRPPPSFYQVSSRRPSLLSRSHFPSRSSSPVNPFNSTVNIGRIVP
jgi:hypothetical protein